MARSPALQTSERLGFRRSAGDLDQGHRGTATTGRTHRLAGSGRRDFTLGGRRPVLALASRQLDAGRLARLLGEMRRPGRVAEAGRLMLCRKLEQCLERAYRLVDAFR